MGTDVLQLSVHSFMISVIFHTIVLMIGAWIIKKYWKALPQQLTPIFTIFNASAISMIWFYVKDVSLPEHPWFYLFIGVMEGLMAIGLHSTYKQMKQLIDYKKVKKYMSKERRKNRRVIS